MDKLIKPSLEQGKVVISDRFLRLHKRVPRRRPLDRGGYCEIFEQLCHRFARARHHEIVLDIDAREGLERAGRRDNGDTDRMGSEKLEFYQKVREDFSNSQGASPKGLRLWIRQERRRRPSLKSSRRGGGKTAVSSISKAESILEKSLPQRKAAPCDFTVRELRHGTRRCGEENRKFAFRAPMRGAS